MELLINTIIILVILLVLLLVSRTTYDFSDVGEEKIDAAGSVTNCGILCWQRCRGDSSSCGDYDINPFNWKNCGCKVYQTGCW